MSSYKRIDIGNKYFGLEVFECPKEIILFAAKLGSKNVTVENYTHYRNPNSLKVQIVSNGKEIQPKLLYYQIDFQIHKDEFIDLIEIWDNQGCYAIFHEKEALKIKATDFEGLKKYQILENFDWTLELAIPDGASSGWGQITSPNKLIIDQIEEKIKLINDPTNH